MPARKSSAKQFERFAIERMSASHPAMRKLRRDGHIASIHGNKHWPAADLLMDYFERHPIPKRKRVIDAGCGWGLGGIYCARTFKSSVFAVDADEAVFPYLQVHAELNGVDIEQHIGTFQSVKGKLLKDTYAVVGADICFWDEMVKPLHGLIKRALDAGAKRVAIADPGRSPFYKLTEKCAKKYGGELLEWQSEEYPEIDGFILEIRNK
ncbi:MAG TPA: methyltransferase [Spongiibacteraceae bacterium]|nr:methyltransferase [Spongiibacteraceae bacterium]